LFGRPMFSFSLFCKAAILFPPLFFSHRTRRCLLT
jgi:hypothetical protein